MFCVLFSWPSWLSLSIKLFWLTFKVRCPLRPLWRLKERRPGGLPGRALCQGGLRFFIVFLPSTSTGSLANGRPGSLVPGGNGKKWNKLTHGFLVRGVRVDGLCD